MARSVAVKKAVPCYGIRKGRDGPEIVQSWTEVVNKTNGFPGAEFKKFKSTAEATAYLQEATERAAAPSVGQPGSATMWFDGGSRGNPGVSGAGAVIFNSYEKELYSGYKYVGGYKTNNEAEYEGMILGLRAAVTLGAKQLIIKGDSMLVIQQMMGRWRVSAPKLVGLHRQASDIVEHSKLSCTWQHVPRGLNARADLLANIAMDSKTGDEIFDPCTGVARGSSHPSAAAGSASPRSALPGVGASAAPANPAPPFAKPTSSSLAGVASAGTSSAPIAVAASPAPAPSSVATGRARPAPRASSGNSAAEDAAALASAKAAYAAVAADARASIGAARGGGGGETVDIFGDTSKVVPPKRALLEGAKVPRSSPATVDLTAEGRGRREGVVEPPKRQLVVHVASWRKTEGTAEKAAAAAILYGEGSWRRLNVLMRVARCRAQPTRGAQQPQEGATAAGNERRGGKAGRSLSSARDAILVLGEVLEEIELLGGCKVAAVTNEPALAELLAPSPRVADRNAPEDAANPDDDPLPPTVTAKLKRVLKRWADLDGVFLEAADENELASAVMLARCCADPPPVSTLAWSSGVAGGAGVRDSSVGACCSAVASAGSSGTAYRTAVTSADSSGAAYRSAVASTGTSGTAYRSAVASTDSTGASYRNAAASADSSGGASRSVVASAGSSGVVYRSAVASADSSGAASRSGAASTASSCDAARSAVASTDGSVVASCSAVATADSSGGASRSAAGSPETGGGVSLSAVVPGRGGRGKPTGNIVTPVVWANPFPGFSFDGSGGAVGKTPAVNVERVGGVAPSEEAQQAGGNGGSKRPSGRLEAERAKQARRLDGAGTAGTGGAGSSSGDVGI